MPLTKWQPPTPRHDVDEEGHITWLELFFDLVYVAALIQLGDRLASDLSWRGVISFAGIFVMLWWTWTGTTAYTNRFAVDDLVHRLLTFVQMFAVGNLALLAATRPDNWQVWLVVAYIAARVPLVFMYLRAGHSTPAAKPITSLFVRVFGASLVLWLLSLFVSGDVRYIIWGLALAVEFGAPAVAVRRPTIIPADDEHFQERYAIFTIIVLGETFVKTLSLIADRGISIETQVFGGLAFVMLIAIWWTYFDDVADAHIRERSALASAPGTNRLVWVYTHLPLAAGITGFGVAAKKIVAIETFSSSFKTSGVWLLVGSLIVVLLAVAILDLVTASPHYAVDAPERVGPRLLAAAALLALGVLGAAVKIDGVLLVSLISAVVVAQIAVEVVIAQKSEHRITQIVHEQIAAASGTCAHLTEAAHPAIPEHPVCEGCEAMGKLPVQLRMCLDCGHVGCCDDTPGLHARAHYEETGHATIITLEPGDDWAYCYLDDVSAPGFLESQS